jgi:hypothetical protein
MEVVNVMHWADNYCSTFQKDASTKRGYYTVILTETFYNSIHLHNHGDGMRI